MSKVISTDVPADLAEQIEEARESDESRSAAVRRLVRLGLDAQNPAGWRDRAGSALAILLVIGYPTAAAASGAPKIAVGWIALVVVAVLFEPWISSAINRIPNPINWFRT